MERRYWKETGEGVDETGVGGVCEGAVGARQKVSSEELVKEFETILAEADKLYAEIEKSTIENGISRTKQLIALR
jgi:hypothetical protein